MKFSKKQTKTDATFFYSKPLSQEQWSNRLHSASSSCSLCCSSSSSFCCASVMQASQSHPGSQLPCCRLHAWQSLFSLYAFCIDSSILSLEAKPAQHLNNHQVVLATLASPCRFFQSAAGAFTVLAMYGQGHFLSQRILKKINNSKNKIKKESKSQYFSDDTIRENRYFG
jgi:hypothetical protein